MLALAAPVVLQIDRAPWDALVAAGCAVPAPLPGRRERDRARLVAARASPPRRRTIAACTAVGELVFYAGGAPLVSQVTSERRIADVITAHAEAPIVSYAVTPASLMFYVGRPVVRLDRPRALRQLLAEQPFAWIVTTPASRRRDRARGARLSLGHDRTARALRDAPGGRGRVVGAAGPRARLSHARARSGLSARRSTLPLRVRGKSSTR